MSARLFSLRETSTGRSPVATERPDDPAIFKRGREAAALLLFAASVFLALALASAQLDPHDPNVSGSDWMGPVGAAVARFLLQGFGLVACLGPVELVLIGIPLLRGQAPRALGLRLTGDWVVAIVAAALVYVAFPEGRVFGAALAGGNVGMLFGELMRGMFSAPGSFLVGATAIALILIGRSSFSFIAFCQRSLELAHALYFKVRAVFERLFTAWGQASAARKEARANLERQDLPRVPTAPSDTATLVHLVDDDSTWIPTEQTGAPPLALSEALRRGLAAPYEAFLSEPTVSTSPVPAAPAASRVIGPLAKKPPLLEPEDPEEASTDGEDEVNAEDDLEDEPSNNVAKAAPLTPRRRQEQKSGPTIVDTSPEREVKRLPAKAEPKTTKRAGFVLPSSDLLAPPSDIVTEIDRGRVLELAQKLEKTLADYGVSAKVEEIHPGPTVTTYEVSPEAGTKVSKVSALSDDLALGLSRKVRIIAPIPGKNRIGFELPNDERVPVSLRELVEDKRFEALAQKAPLPVVLGRDIVGAPFYGDLASMPHVIVAGATGAGKSVGLNVMLASLLFYRTPEDLRFLMIDPKVVELAPFDGIPHMLLPVVTDMKQAATALKWAVNEMERRYQAFAGAGTKNITTYNRWVERVHAGEIPAPKSTEVSALSAEGVVVNVPCAKDGTDGVLLPGKLPYIVIVVDEFADLMMQQGKDVEVCVARLAQKARAAGMHVVLATQRPSVDVITGMIKANFPSRIAFRVAQKVDSRTILDEQGAEVLLGRGDMLVKLNGSSETRRVQCPFVSEEEVSALTDYLRTQGTPQYHEAILVDDGESEDGGNDDAQLDARFDEAVRIVGETQRCSTSWLQRKMTIGYNRAAKIVEQMEKRGMVGPPNGAKDREVLIPPGI
ncbi:MAG: DNA translocase FtsK 4TM domain-containing protein [Polyangiaceae bacterium]|nr:DNA translocase FtsK 4TM domain-containing protein [Polyangiaceae bacterium]